jgi:hypothetical protein
VNLCAVLDPGTATKAVQYTQMLFSSRTLTLPPLCVSWTYVVTMLRLQWRPHDLDAPSARTASTGSCGHAFGTSRGKTAGIYDFFCRHVRCNCVR